MSMDLTELKKRIKGMVTVLISPYTKEGDIDLEGVILNTEYVIDFATKDNANKDVVILVNGSTMEFYANSIEEQKKIIKTVVETVNGKVPVIAGVSQAAAKRTIEMAKYAEEAGADCAMVTPPYYQKGSKEGTYQYFETIAESVKIGIVIYNNLDVSGVAIPVDLFGRLAKINNIVAVKDNSPIVYDYAFKSLSIDPNDMVLLMGLGEVPYVGAAAYGNKYRGYVSVLGNFAPQLSYPLYEAVEEGNFKKAFEILQRISPFESFFGKAQSTRSSISLTPWVGAPTMFTSVVKFALDQVGLRGGPYNRGQLPMEELTEEEKQELKEVLKKIGAI